MWEKYGDMHKGFCVGIITQKLIDSSIKFHGDHVKYYDKLPTLNPVVHTASEIAQKKAFSKLKQWHPEDEFRILKLEYNGFINDDKRKYILPDSYIAEIILGMHMEEEHKREIVAIVKNKKIKIYEIYQSPDSNELKKRLLDY